MSTVTLFVADDRDRQLLAEWLGEEYEVSFELKDSWLLEYDYDGEYTGDEDDIEDEYETVTANVTFEDRDAEFDTQDVEGDDYVIVEPAEDQTITGSTNVAPGTELRIRAEGVGDTRFVTEQTEIVVQPDGTFSAEFDFSERAVDEEFEVSLLSGNYPDDITADGLFVESTAPETTTPEPTTTEPEPTTTEPEPTTTEPEPTTTEPEPTTTEPEPTETTETQTPGFGIAVAMLALIGAALIALRRRS